MFITIGNDTLKWHIEIAIKDKALVVTVLFWLLVSNIIIITPTVTQTRFCVTSDSPFGNLVKGIINSPKIKNEVQNEIAGNPCNQTLLKILEPHQEYRCYSMQTSRIPNIVQQYYSSSKPDKSRVELNHSKQYNNSSSTISNEK